MKFYRLKFWNGFGGGRETHDGVFALFGLTPETQDPRDVTEIWVEGERREEIEKRVRTWAEEFYDFMIVRHNTREIAKYYGGSAWFLLIPFHDPGAELRELVSCQQVLARLPPESYARLNLDFWISVDAKVIPRGRLFSDEAERLKREAGSDRSAWLVHVPIEQADELIAAMGLGRYQFLTVCLMTREEQSPGPTAQRIEKQATSDEFLRTLLAEFPTIFLVDRELLVLVWTRDLDFLRAFVSALGGRLPPQVFEGRKRGLLPRPKRQEFTISPKRERKGFD